VQRNFTVVDIIKQRKLQLVGHMCRMPDRRLIKAIMLGVVDGDRHRGRPPRRWVDDIVDWCGRSLPVVVWLTADREKSGKGSSLASTAHKGHELRRKSAELHRNMCIITVVSMRRRLEVCYSYRRRIV